MVSQPLPDRPLDGISLEPLIDGRTTKRPSPICFWNYDTRHEINSGLEPYLAAKDQEGTTPLVKQMNGRLTRNFRSLHHPRITARDFVGPRAILDNDYKLVIDGQKDGESTIELFDLRHDQAESSLGVLIELVTRETAESEQSRW